jgi:hypothetical protein
MAFSNDRRSPHGVFGIYNKEPIIALKLHNETILKDMYDKGVELKYENVFDRNIRGKRLTADNRISGDLLYFSASAL